MLRWAERQGLVPDPPAMPPPPKKEESLTDVITEAELEEICAAHRAIQYTTRRHCLMWRFLFYQGLRPGEMYELRVRNVNVEAGEIQIGDPDWRQTSGEESTIPLLPPGRFYIRPFLTGGAWGDKRSREASDRVFGVGPGARRPSSSWKRAVRKSASVGAHAMTETAGGARLNVHAPAQLRHALAPGGQAAHLGEPAAQALPGADHNGVRPPRRRRSAGDGTGLPDGIYPPMWASCADLTSSLPAKPGYARTNVSKPVGWTNRNAPPEDRSSGAKCRLWRLRGKPV